MANNGIKITAPVSVSDLASVLGVSEDIYTNAEFNRWAKYKPEVNPTRGNLTLEQRRANSFGLDMDWVTSKAALMVKYNIGLIGFKPARWSHIVPNGSASQPHRIGDCNGYKADTPSPFDGVVLSGSVFDNSYHDTGITVELAIKFDETISDDIINIREIGGIKDCYFGAIAYQVLESGSTATPQASIVTATDTIVNGAFSVYIDTFNLPIGKWKIYPFFSTKKTAQTLSEPSGAQYAPVPYALAEEVEITKGGVVTTTRAICWKPLLVVGQPQKYYIGINITLENKGASAVTFKNNFFRVRYITNPTGSNLVDGEFQVDFPSIDIAAQNFWSYYESQTHNQVVIQGQEYVYFEVPEALYKSAKVYIYLDSGRVTQELYPLRSSTDQWDDLTIIS